jgi:hypothetical protein
LLNRNPPCRLIATNAKKLDFIGIFRAHPLPPPWLISIRFNPSGANSGANFAAGSTAIFRAAAERVAEIRRIEEIALRGGADSMHHPRTDLPTSAKLGGHALQEGIPHAHVKRPSGGEHGVQFGIG